MKPRQLLGVCLIAVLTISLAGCSSATTANEAAAPSTTAISTAPAGPWTYTDGSGTTLTLDAPPERIVAHAGSAAAMIPLGIRPVGIYADQPIADDPALKGLDLTGIEIVGQEWGVINVEKVAALEPDLILAEWWPLESAYSGMEEATGAKEAMLKIAPVAGPAQSTSIVGLIEDYEDLATSLGADVDSPAATEAKAGFEASLAAFKSAVAAKPNLSVLAVSPTVDAIYVAAPAGAAELSDFVSWGLQITAPAVADDRGYWETLSWENAGKYQPDLLLIDDRYGTSTLDAAQQQPTWDLMKAAEVGAVVDWPAYWLRNYADYSAELDALTTAVTKADENLA